MTSKIKWNKCRTELKMNWEIIEIKKKTNECKCTRHARACRRRRGRTEDVFVFNKFVVVVSFRFFFVVKYYYGFMRHDIVLFHILILIAENGERL